MMFLGKKFVLTKFVLTFNYGVEIINRYTTFLKHSLTVTVIFQIQDLSVRVSSELEASEIQLMVDDVRLGTLDGSRFRDGEEWTLFNHVETQHVPEDDQRGKGWASRVEKGYTAGRVIAMCRVARRSRLTINI